MRAALLILGLASCAAPVETLSLKDPAGASFAPLDGPVVLLFFLGTECPVSNYYAPDMRRIAEAAGDRGVDVYGVYPEPDAEPTGAARHAEEYGLGFAVLLDPDQALAKRTGIRRVPTAVLARDGEIVYRGRIDDRYSLDGKRRNAPRTRDLEDALGAVLAGRPPAHKETPVYGCRLLLSVKDSGE